MEPSGEGREAERKKQSTTSRMALVESVVMRIVTVVVVIGQGHGGSRGQDYDGEEADGRDGHSYIHKADSVFRAPLSLKL